MPPAFGPPSAGVHAGAGIVDRGVDPPGPGTAGARCPPICLTPMGGTMARLGRLCANTRADTEDLVESPAEGQAYSPAACRASIVDARFAVLLLVRFGRKVHVMQMKREIWLLVLRGVVAIVFGVLAILWPGVTLLALALLFGAYVLVDGVLTMIGAFRRRDGATQRTAYILIGLLSIAAGAVALLWPRVTALVLVVLVGAWAVVTGLLAIVAATRAPNGWLPIVVGVASIVAGILIFMNPGAGAFALALLIGVYALVGGVFWAG